MPPRPGFDNEKYLAEQTAAILERVGRFNNKLYLEFGGKLLYDYHAARVLPGFAPNVKMRLLQKLRDKAAVILCIFAGDIERKKVRADFGITYDSDAMKQIDDLEETLIALGISAISTPAAQAAVEKLKDLRGCDVHMTHMPTPGDEAGLRKLGVNLTSEPNFATKCLFIN
mgnify:CR=1 FL=1